MKNGKMEIITKHKYWRLLELVPGLLAWSVLILPIILSFIAPVVVAVFALFYAILWLFRSFKLCINLWRGYYRTKEASAANWNYLLDLVEHSSKIENISRIYKKPMMKSQKILFDEIKTLQNRITYLKKHNDYLKPSEVYHAILFVTYKESWDVIHESVKSYVNSFYPYKKPIFVFAGEEGDKENFLKLADKIKDEFGKDFTDILVTVHPKGVPGEIPGKSSNATYAAKELKKYLDEKEISYNKVMLNNFDADTVVHPYYFSELTYKYVVMKKRTQKSYQPIHMFHNNIWDVPMAIRMVALACTFWRLAESLDVKQYKSFSSRSMAFQTAVDTNYWDPSVIPEDSRQFWTAFMKYDGKHEVVAIYTPVYLDAVLSDTYVETFKSQYSQLRRWAWGVVDFPFMAINLARHPKIPFGEKVYRIFFFLENAFFWATGPIVIMIAGWLPTILNPGFRDQVLAYNLPIFTSQILTIAAVGIIMCAVISLVLVPKKQKENLIDTVSLIFQWLLVPIVSILLSAIPALDAQTKLMFNKHLEYEVTKKSRKS